MPSSSSSQTHSATIFTRQSIKWPCHITAYTQAKWRHTSRFRRLVLLSQHFMAHRAEVRLRPVAVSVRVFSSRRSPTPTIWTAWLTSPVLNSTFTAKSLTIMFRTAIRSFTSIKISTFWPWKTTIPQIRLFLNWCWAPQLRLVSAPPVNFFLFWLIHGRFKWILLKISFFLFF